MGSQCCRNVIDDIDKSGEHTLHSDYSRGSAEDYDCEVASTSAEPGRFLGKNAGPPGLPVLDPRPLEAMKEEPSDTQAMKQRIEPSDTPLPEVPTRTLNANGLAGDVADRHKAFEKRKEARKKKRSEKNMAGQGPSAMLLKDGFLSNVPEVDTDIPYRYAFMVMGYFSDTICDATCLSEVARGLPHAANADLVREGNEGPDLLSQSASAPASGTPMSTKSSRCLCPVPYPTGRANDHDRLKLSKLVFSAYSYRQEPPECYSRLEASSCAIVFIIVVDPENSEDEPMEPFVEQLWAYERALECMRLRSLPEFRPVRAIILCRVGEAPAEDQGNEPWVGQLEEFEGVTTGSLWKFGHPRPISVQDGNNLHGAFAQIASTRILKNADGGDSDRSEEGLCNWTTEHD